MNLKIRKIIVLLMIGAVFLAANILVVANWITESGIAEKANWVRETFLTGTAIAVIITLLILFVNPKSKSGRAVGFLQGCPVCDKKLFGNQNYCGECGSKV